MLKTLAALVRSNRYFYVPFFLWVLTGGILLSLYSKDQLFLGVNGAHCFLADILVTGSTYLGDGIAFGVMLVVLLIMRKWRLFLVGAGSLLFITLVVQSIKHYVNDPRPILYFQDPSILHIVPWIDVHSGLSFPSGHTSTAFGMFCFLALILHNKKWGLLLCVLALSTAHSRLYLSQHFFADVYFGSIIGTLCSTMLYWLFEYKRSQTPGTTCLHNTAATPSAGMA